MTDVPIPLYSAEQIRARVTELAASLDSRFAENDTLHVVAVLKGSFVFLADLIRAMRRPLTVDFVRMASYGSATTTSGEPRLIQGAATDLCDRHVVIVDDILDTGAHRAGAAAARARRAAEKPSARWSCSTSRRGAGCRRPSIWSDSPSTTSSSSATAWTAVRRTVSFRSWRS